MKIKQNWRSIGSAKRNTDGLNIEELDNDQLGGSIGQMIGKKFGWTLPNMNQVCIEMMLRNQWNNQFVMKNQHFQLDANLMGWGRKLKLKTNF